MGTSTGSSDDDVGPDETDAAIEWPDWLPPQQDNEAIRNGRITDGKDCTDGGGYTFL